MARRGGVAPQRGVPRWSLETARGGGGHHKGGSTKDFENCARRGGWHHRGVPRRILKNVRGDSLEFYGFGCRV